ncbi:MAG: hypothetical protein JSV88_26210, partial [Candidatus Aminicenantes bacterium]
MKKKSGLFRLLGCLIIFFSFLPLHSSDQCNAPPPPGPPPDNADENHSFNLEGAQNSNTPNSFDLYPFVGIIKNGNFEAIDNLLQRIGRGCFYVRKDFNPEKLIKTIDLLIIPTGGLFGVDGSSSSNFKFFLEQYVSQGGTILCFAQQDSGNFLTLPAGESFHALGWRNSQSCYHGSIYFSQTVPIFAGQTSQRISAGVDGGFSSF